jgi:hypothetical protein
MFGGKEYPLYIASDLNNNLKKSMFMATTTATQVKQEVYVTYAQLEEVLIGLENQVPIPFISGTFLTNPSNMVKTSKIDGSINPYWKTEIKKLQSRRVRLVVSYKNRTTNNGNNEGIEGEYTPKALIGKKHVDYANSILTDLETETKRYVMVEWFEEIKDKPSKYLLNGTELDKAIVNKYINYPPQKPEQMGQERKVNVITPMFESIISLNANGKKYIVIHE